VGAGPVGLAAAAYLAQLNQGQAQQRADARQQLREAGQKLETLEERFVMGEITGPQFEKYGAKVRAGQLGTGLSNLAELSMQVRWSGKTGENWVVLSQTNGKSPSHETARVTKRPSAPKAHGWPAKVAPRWPLPAP